MLTTEEILTKVENAHNYQKCSQLLEQNWKMLTTGRKCSQNWKMLTKLENAQNAQLPGNAHKPGNTHNFQKMFTKLEMLTTVRKCSQNWKMLRTA